MDTRLHSWRQFLGFTGQGYYAWRSRSALRQARAQQRRRFDEAVAKEFENSRQTYGAPRLAIALCRRGIHADKQTTQTVLKALDMAIGLRGRAPRKLVLHADPDPHGYRRSHTRQI
ncbi:hypothetical protein SAMN05421878_12410 [Actinobaculum suis]|uniref:HTH-like domain-containing protein n=1 Tax=Actinobaculum suis TaxID=1657 RepID=A0A1G7EV97_9ACTO|nr:hypothetical protein SAMN05421878_12410 [Actinobaculum suis]